MHIYTTKREKERERERERIGEDGLTKTMPLFGKKDPPSEIVQKLKRERL